MSWDPVQGGESTHALLKEIRNRRPFHHRFRQGNHHHHRQGSHQSEWESRYWACYPWAKGSRRWELGGHRWAC